MKLTAVSFPVILSVVGMSFINEDDAHHALSLPAYKKDTIPALVSDTIGAEFPGGYVAWRNFLNRNLKYPKDTSIIKKTETVVVEFVIDERGDVTNVKADNGLEPLRAEAMRVINKSGKWIPGRLQSTGRFIKSFKRQPFVFRAPED